MFSFFAQHGVSYTPSFIFRPYYLYFQTSEICGFTWVSCRIVLFFFPALFYHHSSFCTVELQCILKLGSYLFLIFFLILCFPWWWSFFFSSPHIYLSTTFSPWIVYSFSSVQIHLCLTPPFLHSSLVFLIPCRGSSTCYATFL